MAGRTTLKGDAGSRIAIANLTTAVFGEAHHATLAEEGRHLDLRIGFPSPFDGHVQREFFVQVKTGAHAVVAAGRWRFDNISREHRAAWSKSTVPVMVCCVRDQPILTVLYRFIDRATPVNGPLTASRHSFVSPLLRFDAERELVMFNGPGQPTSKVVVAPSGPLSATRPAARIHYDALHGIKVPGFGPVSFAKHGWRHMTRESKSHGAMSDGLRLLPALAAIMQRPPHRFQELHRERRSDVRHVHERRMLLLSFLNVPFVREGYHQVFVRLLETTVYPKDWLTRTDLHDCVTHTLSFESAYRKPERPV